MSHPISSHKCRADPSQPGRWTHCAKCFCDYPENADKNCPHTIKGLLPATKENAPNG